MRAIPVELGAFERFLCVWAPQQKLVDSATGEVKKDRQSGETVWELGVCAVRGRDSSVERVSVVGEPIGVTVGAPLRLVGLVATPWEQAGRSGVAFRAERVMAAASAGAPSAGPRPEAGKGGGA